MAAEQIILILTPLIVFLVTELVKYLLPKVSGWIVISIFVPIVSLVAAWVSSMVISGDNFWAQAGIGLLAVFVNELIRQLKQIGTPQI